MAGSLFYKLPPILLLFLSSLPPPGSSVFHRNNMDISSRRIEYRKADTNEYDTITLDNYLRNYMRGPISEEYVFYNRDVITAYVGPAPPYPKNGSDMQQKLHEKSTFTIRVWAMFDEITGKTCDLNTVHDWGELALFVCPHPGLYRAYAVDVDLDVSQAAEVKSDDIHLSESTVLGKPTLIWTKSPSKEMFDLLFNHDSGFLSEFFSTHPSHKKNKIVTEEEKIEVILTKTRNNEMAVSDPITVKHSFFCYYWMFNLKEVGREGYSKKEVIHPQSGNETSFIMFELRIWVAEPNAVLVGETEAHSGSQVVSQYSRMITNRFFDTGLYPCLRKAHRVIEIVEEIRYIKETDQDNILSGAPHWLARVKVHTDRLISTLSDITFTIASRQNTGSFHCFVGDIKVYLNVREFEFVPHARLELKNIKLEYTNAGTPNKFTFKHGPNQVFGHGVQYIGNRFTKIYQPSTNRSDMVIVNNPCLAQEFAMAVGGSLYIAEGFLVKGMRQVKRVVLPDFINSHGIDTDPNVFRDYMRVADVTFTPTHAVFLMADSTIILHPTSAKDKGIGAQRDSPKYKLTSIVKRRWCPHTSTPKFSGMMVPLFSRVIGNIVILHVYSIEGNVRMWVTPTSSSCLGEGVTIVEKAELQKNIVNETEIHYDEFAEVLRTDHKTGLKEPMPPPRPTKPPPSVDDLDLKSAYLLNDKKLTGEGQDPHFPPELLDPARITIGSNLTNYNQAVMYVVENGKEKIEKVLTENGITNTGADDEHVGIYTVEFAAIEKQFITAVKFSAKEIPKDFGAPKSFQMLITTVTMTDFPFGVKLQQGDENADEKLDTIIPFPGTMLVRSKPFKLAKVQSNDPVEEKEHLASLKGKIDAEFTPDIFVLNTAIPSYVIYFGDILVYTSLESRFARPLHFYEWDKIDKMRSGGDDDSKFRSKKKKSLKFSDSQIIFGHKDGQLYDPVVSDQGIISVLWRKGTRFVKDTGMEESPGGGKFSQTVAVGSVISLEGLREVKAFFRYDNIFQRVTPEGEVIYGIYDVKPLAPFRACNSSRESTIHDPAACIEHGSKTLDGPHPKNLPYCTTTTNAPCKSPQELPICPDSDSDLEADSEETSTEIPKKPKTEHEPCLRLNKLKCNASSTTKLTAFDCWPKFAPKEELRSVEFMGTPFLSYLLGSLKSVSSLHPEAPPEDEEEDDNDYLNLDEEELSICPFSSFKVFNVPFDFAEVGYETRITGEISYFGTGIPTEADLIVEFESIMGVIVQVSSSVEEHRGLTTIKKTIDIQFRMTDFLLGDILDTSNDRSTTSRDFDDVRAREKSHIFSVTIRPSIVNNHCKSTDYFKTVQINVGCNTFSSIRLIAEAAPFIRLNWASNANQEEDLQWDRSTTGNLLIPKAHVYSKQALDKFHCYEKRSNDKAWNVCEIPYHEQFGDNIFTVSYRDHFYPKFEQFLTVSARPVTGNMVIYDLLGSQDYNITINKLQAGCRHAADMWYDKLLNTTSYFKRGATEHENVYKYYINCFEDSDDYPRVMSDELSSTNFHFHNLTNNNKIKFKRHRNEIFIFRAVVVNTDYNRFTYCKTLETFFLVRVVGIPIPREGLAAWKYLLIFLNVVALLAGSYWVFYKFYPWKAEGISANYTSSKERLRLVETYQNNK